MVKIHKSLVSLLFMLAIISCKSGKTINPTIEEEAQPVGPVFREDSAMAFCAEQCAFGPRTMNSAAHDRCEEWIIACFRQYGAEVKTQKTTLQGWDGTALRSTNIIASINADAKERIIICAHWDSRPWADNDPDENNHRKPVMAANDGASGVAVMLEMCRVMQAADSLAVGVDFVCFDAEDYGAPDWAGIDDHEKTWALGAQHFAAQYAKGEPVSALPGNSTLIGGILLDMVGGQGAKFYQEGLSQFYAQGIVDGVWQAARRAGYAAFFPNQRGCTVTDDHKPLNEAGIPTIDIIAYYPDCRQSGFGPTWHTVNDDMQHLDKATLKAVGQTLIQYLYEKR